MCVFGVAGGDDGEDEEFDAEPETEEGGGFADHVADVDAAFEPPGGVGFSDVGFSRCHASSLFAKFMEEKFDVVEGAFLFIDLNGGGGIDEFRTDVGAEADGGAAPNAFVLGHDFVAHVGLIVAAVVIVPIEEGEGSGTDEIGVEIVLRASGVAATAVDALCELLVFFELLRRLQMGFGVGGGGFPGDIGLHAFNFRNHIRDICDEIAFDGEVVEGFEGDGFFWVKFSDEGFAGKARQAIDHDCAGAADSHTAGGTIAEIGVEMIADKVERIEDGGFVFTGDVEGSEVRTVVFFRAIAQDFESISCFAHGCDESVEGEAAP